jgi:small acid-soluble spore protein F (minor alpha/beta-type SASP)
MSKEKDFTEKSFDEMDEKERLKFETATELGLADRLRKDGWKSLSASETGKIGGIMNKKIREHENN